MYQGAVSHGGSRERSVWSPSVPAACKRQRASGAAAPHFTKCGVTKAPESHAECYHSLCRSSCVSLCLYLSENMALGTRKGLFFS